MATGSQPHVFLSHVREDAARVERLASDLGARGVETWIDRHKIRPGERWERAIEAAIRAGAFFVACFSRAYAAKGSSYMNEELHLAAREVRRKPLDRSWFLPVRLDDCPIPDWPIGPELSVRSFQWLDMFPDWTRSIERLAEVIRPAAAAPSAVFIDGDWLRAARVPIDFRKLLERLRQTFGADVTPAVHLTVRDQQGCDLVATLERLGYSVDAAPARKHHSGNGFDMSMALRAAAPSASELVLISGDSDFMPLLEHARQQGRPTVLIAFDRSVARALNAAADRFVDLDVFMRGGGMRGGGGASRPRGQP
jgi:hypothetical protein